MYPGYHRDDVPVLSGYFTPQFAVVDTHAQRELVTPLLPAEFSLDHWDALEGRGRRQYKDLVNHKPDNVSVVVASRQMFHNQAYNRFPSAVLYEYLVDTMCDSLQFNEEAWRDIQAARRRLYNDDLPSDLRDDDAGVSVAFHIRRTDKLIAEASSVPAAVYVENSCKFCVPTFLT
mmetsp:Transcript_1492/g.2885  ORF Transcript_1492/g.2885 Transcript_1492/m.2885 type:complete len:175 (-) Transcript_1492:401-925(-)